MFNIKDLADRLGVTRQTIYNMLRDGRLPVSPIPGSKPRRWTREAIEAWLSASTPTPPLSRE